MRFSPQDTEINRLISQEEDGKGIITIWGDAGTGKTTMCFGASLSVLPEKKVIYINTKPYFKLERFYQMKEYFPKYNKFNFLLYNPRDFKNLIKIIMNLEFLILKEILA